MVFRAWNKGDKLVKNQHMYFLQPNPEKELVLPEILIVPLIAFNEDCHRLGYGGGYYDRTIDNLKSVHKKAILTIGVAFEVMKYDNSEDGLPEFETLDTDEALDYIVTESNIYCGNTQI